MLNVEENNEKDFSHFTITQQLLLLLASVPEKNESLLYKERKKFAIIGAILADTIRMKRAELVQGELMLKNISETNFKYINLFINNMDLINNKNGLSDLIYRYQYDAGDLEDMVLDELLQDGVLIEKKGRIPFLSPKKLCIKEPELCNQLINRVQKAFLQESEPDIDMLYILAILHAIQVLQRFIKTESEYNEKIIQVEELIEKNIDVKMIHEAIKSQPEPDFSMIYYMSPMFLNGGLG